MLCQEARRRNGRTQSSLSTSIAVREWTQWTRLSRLPPGSRAGCNLLPELFCKTDRFELIPPRRVFYEEGAIPQVEHSGGFCCRRPSPIDSSAIGRTTAGINKAADAGRRVRLSTSHTWCRGAGTKPLDQRRALPAPGRASDAPTPRRSLYATCHDPRTSTPPSARL